MISNEFLRVQKNLILRKMELMEQKDNLRESIAKGKDFFMKNAGENDGRLLSNGAVRMLEIVQELEDVENELKSIDTLMIISTEMEVNQADFKFSLPQHPNDIGDIVQNTDVLLTQYAEKDYKEAPLRVDDLWTVILLKEMFEVNNVEVIKRAGGNTE